MFLKLIFISHNRLVLPLSGFECIIHKGISGYKLNTFSGLLLAKPLQKYDLTCYNNPNELQFNVFTSQLFSGCTIPSRYKSLKGMCLWVDRLH